MHLSLEDREQGGNLPHLSLCHLPGDLGAVHSCGVLCLGIVIPLIIISSSLSPHYQISQPLPRYSGKILRVKAVSLVLLLRCGQVPPELEGAGWGDREMGIHTRLSSTEGNSASRLMEVVKSKKTKSFSRRGDGVGVKRCWVVSIQVPVFYIKKSMVNVVLSLALHRHERRGELGRWLWQGARAAPACGDVRSRLGSVPAGKD